ncbi:HEPN domain-containing protein [bacterium]|nr:HEPN domain-containing protein [bacterium]
MENELSLIVSRWVSLADKDLRSAIIVMTDTPPITNTACYHAQQCVEKSFKAILASNKQHIGKMHDLVVLLEKCVVFESELEQFKNKALLLNDYSVTTRYPDDWQEYSIDHANRAINYAREIFSFTKALLNSFL